jgi:hypothetical protein
MTAHLYSNARQNADLIFVFAGRVNRKLFGLELFNQGLAPRILFSVGRFEIRRFSKMALPTQLDLLKLAQEVPPPQRHFFVFFHGAECHVQHIQPRRFGTLTEMASLARWLDANPQVQSLIVISNETHLRRIGMCCRSLLPRTVKVALLAVPSSFLDSANEQSSAIQSRDSVVLEFLKVIVYRVLLTLRSYRRRRPS